MRTAIQRALVANSTVITSWKQAYEPGPTTPKPYGVILMAGQVPANSRAGALQTVEVWLYAEDVATLDAASIEIRRILDGQTLITTAGDKFVPQWASDGRDFWDDDLKAKTRQIDFLVPLYRG